MPLTILPWYTGIFLALAEFFLGSAYTDSVNQTFYVAGIISGYALGCLLAHTTRPTKTSNAWLANPSGLNTVVYETNALQGVITTVPGYGTALDLYYALVVSIYLFDYLTYICHSI